MAEHSIAKLLNIAVAIKQESQVRRWTEATRAYARRRDIWCPAPRTLWKLYVWAHECGHVVLHGNRNCPRTRSHVKEYQAELYAHDALRRHGLQVPNGYTASAKRYVASRIEHLVAIRRERVVDRAAFNYCKPVLQSQTRRAYQAGRLRFSNDSKELLERYLS